MNEELLLKKYLFNFLRSPDYLTDVNFYIPKFLPNDPAFAETQRVLSWEHERYRLKIIDFAKQFHPQTATWGLSTWEEELGLKTDLNEDLELRRSKVMAKLLGASPMTVANTNKLVNLFTNDGKAYVDELPEDGTIKIIIPSKKAYVDEMRNALDELLPAHLVYYFQHIIEIDVDDDDDDKTDSVADINDDDSPADTHGKAFFVEASFPITENVPYGSWYSALKYDGSVQVKAPYIQNGGVQYNGETPYFSINPDTVRYGKPCNWWFVSNGESNFGKEFRHDGAIKYDGLKPQTIEYDDGMDEPAFMSVTKILEDDVAEQNQFNGAKKYDGKSTILPSDNNGNIELKRYRTFNGAIQYSGGDLNYFNGAIRANGRFDFSGNGIRAEVEILTDDIDGNLSNHRPEKENPPFKYVENFDFVPKTLEEQSVEIMTGKFEDTVEATTDDNSALTILRSVRYNGSKDYSGGDLNYYNGTMRADGKFNFDSKGTQAKVEVIAVDIDDSFSISRVEKETPPFRYVENFDFVPQILEEQSAEITTAAFEDTADVEDGNGSLIIRRRTRYDGNLSYQGYFEYAANASRHYDGNLNYNGVYRVSADGIAQYNHLERYGGRKNSTVVEYISNLDGSAQIIDVHGLEKIPIATREKLGFVIIGDNIDVTENGKISLPERLRPQKMTAMSAETLSAILSNRRG